MTLTVIASEPETGTIGLATMTCLVGVGDVVPAGRLNVGLIACQAHIRPNMSLTGNQPDVESSGWYNITHAHQASHCG